MDEDVALAPTDDDNTGLAPEVRAELLALAQGARETIGKKWSPHTHRAYAGAWSRFPGVDRGPGTLIPAGRPGHPHPVPRTPGAGGPGPRPPSGPPPAPSPRRTGRRGSVAATRRPTRT